ncbi:hypothetical protein VC83_06440 [Pseudogymnoascus destructans]|uniref:J domain-containing protein n=2 Tax=Pseudogymnoascus destructans TaxID=655981 RepID=L8FN16_PSED2|nr:uncharacterized protein VC83_06440 [Pseudogymnoascus destructans]ELR02307.1 hypothetical protein GMDG_05376 [Pseudogymnoascus destructans 20631-21]OAF58268.1 hypothetical protein VC83_06440 [Pseudogymnoascus destructans]
MAPALVTEDYYMALEVGQTASPELVIKSYRRLALKLHPDRNTKHDATEAFQLLGRAYDTLKDETKRQAYDSIYPTITRSGPYSQTTQTPHPAPASTPQSGALSEAAQIAALQKSKQERSACWRTEENVFDSSIFELRRDVRRLEQEIKDLDSIVAAEAAAEAQKNSWGTWLLSSIQKKAEDTEKEKERKDRERQERKIMKDMKERRLGLKKADLKKVESLLQSAKKEVDTADLVDTRRIQVIQDRIRAREKRERQDNERVARERIARIRKQQQEQREKQEREAAEACKIRQAEERAAEQKRQEEQARRWQKINDDEAKEYRKRYANVNHPRYSFGTERSAREASVSTCHHGGWWRKIQGRTACPKCYVSWNYLLQCPGCMMKACAGCQAAIRPSMPRNTARTN